MPQPGFRLAALVEGRRLVDIAIDIAKQDRRYQSLWKARIDRIVPGVGAFAALGGGTGLLRATKGRLPQSGDTAIVEITSLRSEGKAHIISSDPALPGRFFILLPRAETIALSSRLNGDKAAQQALTQALQQAGIGGGILRNTALSVPQGEVIAEAQALQAEWRALEATAHSATPGTMLRQGPDCARRLQLDYPAHALLPSDTDLESLGFEAMWDCLQQPEVKLPRGGSIIIEETSALTAIDVNAGTRPAAEIDREALPLIVEQIRLRNLSGLIVIDFAAAQSKKTNAEDWLATIRRALDPDPARCRLVGMSPSGLIEITRPARDLPLAEKLKRLD